MLEAINSAFNEAKNAARDDQMIIEAVLDVEVDDVVPGSDEDFDEEVVDADSVPEDVYKKIDAELDKMVGSDDYDDTDAESMVDDDDIDVDDDELEAAVNVVIEEACTAWYDDESIGHSNTKIRKNDKHDQPEFDPCKKMGGKCDDCED